MKILVVTHRYPPAHQGGAELYAHAIASRLARRHDVVAMSTDDALQHRNYSRRSYTLDGVRVIEFTNHRRYGAFEHSYADPEMEQHFLAVMKAVRPDLVHFQHVLHHSIVYPAIAHMMGVPTVATLHEYWMLCGRNGQLVQADGTLCEGPAFSACSPCMAGFLWGRSGLDVWALRGIAGVKRVTGVDLKATARKIRLRGVEKPAARPESGVVEAMRRNIVIRESRMRDAMDDIDVFLAPSAFLRQRFIDFGVHASRILHAPLGVDLERFAARRRPGTRPDGPLRVGFLGSVQPVKGVDVLLRAMIRLEGRPVTAEIYGEMASKPEFVRELIRAAPATVRFPGRIESREVPDALARLDVLVVPSVWWENSPLVILEAFAAGVPVVCSDIGGMAELVEHDRSGLHFAAGDDEALARTLARLVDEPGLLRRLADGIRPPRALDDDVAFHEALYEAVIEKVDEA